MTILAILNQKGGSGKTTICTNLAVALIERGYTVTILDTDPQRSASKWNAVRDPDSQLPVDQVVEANTLVSNARIKAKTYDVVMIDGAAVVQDSMAAAIKAADAVIIPCMPGMKDLWGTTGVVDILQARYTVTDGIPKAAFVVSNAERGRILSREIADKLLELNLPVLDTQIHHLEDYKTVDLAGLGVTELAPNGAASMEMTNLIDELIENGLLEAKHAAPTEKAV
jgi:chromosome partitioning protein